jgi:2-oxoisovalerate dehydrogenase E1 component
MSVVSRTGAVERNLLDAIARRPATPPAADLDAPLRDGSDLTLRRALHLCEVQFESRILDLLARELKNENQSFYTIGSSGHEGNAAVADVLRTDDLAFLHYRSGAFFCARAINTPGISGAFDVLTGLVASADEPIAGGRHKVFGSGPLCIPPQTSTIASHLPKAVGYAMALDRRARFEGRREERIAVVTFGDASANHATAQAAFNTAGWATHQHVPVPLLFVCEDNGIGISTRTPTGWIAEQFRHRAGLRYFACDGLDLPDVWGVAGDAQRYVREQRRPAFLHVRTVRMMGHAGSDVEQTYRTPQEIQATEARDPLIATATMLIDAGAATPEQLTALWHGTRRRLRALADEALRRPKLVTREEIVRPLFRHDEHAVAAAAAARADDTARRAAFGATLPEDEDKPRHLAVQLNRALLDLLLADRDTLLFGEDVARKGGVYNVTTDLSRKIRRRPRVQHPARRDQHPRVGHRRRPRGVRAVPRDPVPRLPDERGRPAPRRSRFDAVLQRRAVPEPDGRAHRRPRVPEGLRRPLPQRQRHRPAPRDPGLLVACPARGDDAVRMLRTLYGAAKAHGRVTVFLEPIALYMTKDLYADGDGQWLAPYPGPGESLPVGDVGVYRTTDGPVDLVVATYANGLWMSLRVAARLEALGHTVRVLDLRWLHPLPVEAVARHARDAGRLLVVDEARASSGIADRLLTLVGELEGDLVVGRVVGADTYVPLAAAANLVLVQEPEIEATALELLAVPVPTAVAAMARAPRRVPVPEHP